MMKMKMKTMMFSVPPIQFSKNFFFSHKNASSASHKVNSSSRREEDDDIFEDAPTAFCISSFLREERERERE